MYKTRRTDMLAVVVTENPMKQRRHAATRQPVEWMPDHHSRLRMAAVTGKHDDDDDDDEVDDDDGYIEDSVDGCRVHHRTTAHPFLHINKMYRIYSRISHSCI